MKVVQSGSTIFVELLFLCNKMGTFRFKKIENAKPFLESIKVSSFHNDIVLTKTRSQKLGGCPIF